MYVYKHAVQSVLDYNVVWFPSDCLLSLYNWPLLRSDSLLVLFYIKFLNYKQRDQLQIFPLKYNYLGP